MAAELHKTSLLCEALFSHTNGRQLFRPYRLLKRDIGLSHPVRQSILRRLPSPRRPQFCGNRRACNHARGSSFPALSVSRCVDIVGFDRSWPARGDRQGRTRTLQRAHRRAAESRDERAPLHLFASSARASSVGGVKRFGSVEIDHEFKLRRRLVGACAGRSAGIAP